VRIEVANSKHDALYNMMSSHLEQILKAEIASTIASTIKQEFDAALSRLNEKVAEQWYNLQMKTCQRLTCTVVRAKVSDVDIQKHTSRRVSAINIIGTCRSVYGVIIKLVTALS
jgi:hypothetical protein